MTANALVTTNTYLGDEPRAWHFPEEPTAEPPAQIQGSISKIWLVLHLGHLGRETQEVTCSGGLRF